MPDKETAANNLKIAKHLLDGLGIPFFLFLGTALGAYRDKDFCPGDIDDIDIGVHIDHYARLKDILHSFDTGGFELEHHFTHHTGFCPELSFIRKYDGWRSKVDIFFIMPMSNDRMGWAFYSHPPQLRTFTNYLKSFDRVEFYGETYNVPHPIEDYLKENYGEDWKTPISRDKWNWEKDNKAPMQNI